MNEDLIEKLALQVHESLRNSGGQPVFNYEFADKFAELIVKECMSVSNLPNSACGKWDHLLPSQVIAMHFGIESGVTTDE